MDAHEVAGILHALANADRVRLVEEMVTDAAARSAGGGLTIAALADRVEISRFSASRHLGILRDAGIVERRQVGVRSLHAVDRGALHALEDWLYPIVDAMDAGGRADIA